MTTTSMTTTLAAPPAGTYTIDPNRSTITFKTKHLFGAGTVQGTFTGVSGSIVVADSPAAATVTASADAASFDSGDGKRDAKVKSPSFLDVAAHPHISFESTGLVHDGDAWRLAGSLTARGSKAPMELLITGVEPDGAGVTVSAEATVDRYAHGITAMKGMAGRRLTLNVQAHAVRS